MIPLLVIIAACLLYWGTALSLYPVPWPDDSVFVLVARDLMHWPPLFRMHSQAPWVPSYDLANFNTMPGMPVLLALWRSIGFESVHTLRILGVFAFGYFLGLLSSWMRSRKATRAAFWAVLLCALTSPVLRWGSLVTRPEIWEGFFWILILLDLDGYFRKPAPWRIPALLALGAYFHFEAIVWLLPVCLALYPWAEGGEDKLARWLGRLWGVFWRTGALLSPWFVYVLANWSVFVEQMRTQFGRMGGKHLFVDSWHSFFHTLFITTGAPVDYPRFFNAGKIAFVSLAALALVGLAFQLFFHSKRDPRRASVRVAILASVATTLGLWLDKSEVWFITLIHLTLWCAITAFLSDYASFFRMSGARVARAARPLAYALAALLLVVQIGVLGQQWIGARDRGYSWQAYDKWVDCIDSEIGSRTRVWQPTAPDALIGLVERSPRRDYTRFVDFPGPVIEELVRKHWLKTEAVIHARQITGEEKPVVRREDAGLADLYWLQEYPWIPQHEKNALNFPGKAKLRICQQGPFWAAISLQDVK